MERAIGWMDANARGAGMRLDMRWRKPAFAEARICPGGRARNRAYDVQTKHGQTQGVVLGP